jgi:hypothetical protein
MYHPQTRERRLHEHPAREPPIDLRSPAAGPVLPGRYSKATRDGRPGSWALWAVPTWLRRAWSVQTSPEPEPAAAGWAAVLPRAGDWGEAHRRPGYRSVVGVAPARGVSLPAATVRMKVVWRRVGSVRRAAGRPSEGDFVPLQSTIRSARPPSTQSRTAAVVVSPIHPQCATQAPAFSGKSKATLSPFSDKLARCSQVARVPGRRYADHRYAGHADCLSASPESCPKTVSDNLLHDLCCDCLQRTGQAGCAGRLRAPYVLARAT